VPDNSPYDVIVIGGGLGGMLTAAILGRRGRRVLLLEREADLGGRIRSYEVDGFVVDAGAYLWPNAHLSEALRQAGAESFVGSAIPGDRVMRVFVQGEGGKRLSFPWPGRTESPKLIEAARAALGIDPDVYRQLAALWERLAALSDHEVERLRHRSLREALPAYVSDRAVAEAFRRNVMLFGTYDPDSASMADCIGLRRRHQVGARAVPEVAGANRCGGVRALPRAVAAALANAGVEVRCGWAVENIEVVEGRVTGVSARGREPFRVAIEAPAVVSNIPIWQLFDVLGTDILPADFVDEMRRWSVVGGVVASAFAFRQLPHLRETGEADEFPGWTRLVTGTRRWFGGGFLWASHHSPHNTPPGAHLLQAMRLSPQSDIADARRVRAITADFESMLDEIYSDAAEKLLWKRSWSSRDGSEYLVSAARKPPIVAPGVSGLYFVGETVDVPAVQMDAAALSALRCAELVG
jgi:phytoene dehydrogenase-like protein